MCRKTFQPLLWESSELYALYLCYSRWKLRMHLKPECCSLLTLTRPDTTVESGSLGLPWFDCTKFPNIIRQTSIGFEIPFSNHRWTWWDSENQPAFPNSYTNIWLGNGRSYKHRCRTREKAFEVQKYPTSELTPPAALLTGTIRGECEDQYDNTTPRLNHGSFVLCWNYLARLPHKDSPRDYTRLMDWKGSIHEYCPRTI